MTTSRRGFFKVLGVASAASVVSFWQPLPPAASLGTGVYVSSLEVVKARRDFETPTLPPYDYDAQLAVVKDLVDVLTPHTSFVDVERSAAMRAWQLVATRYYVDEKKPNSHGFDLELGTCICITDRMLRTVPPDKLGQLTPLILDALYRGEKEHGWHWNPVTKLGVGRGEPV